MAVQRAPAAQGAHHAALPEGLHAPAAVDVADRAGSARGRHRVVGRRAVHRQAEVREVASQPRRRELTAEEQAFIDGPCEELCRMFDDWDITHKRADMPPQVWDYLKRKGFFAMIIPKKYGGLEFSAYAHSCVLVKLASRSGTAGRDHRRAELARPGRAAQSLRHRGAEEPLPAAPRARRGSAVLRADRPARRLRCRVAARHRRRLQGHVAGQGDRRAQAQLLQALHHARADRHGGRPRVPHVRSRTSCSATRRTSASPAR